MSRSAQIHAVAATILLGLLLAALTILDVYGDKIMKRVLRVAAVAGVGLLAAACSTFDAAGFAKAANDLDPACAKYVNVQVTPLLLFGWPLPVVSGQYTKSCNPEQLPPAVRGTIQSGQPVG